MKKLIAIILCLMAFPSFAATCKISEYTSLVVDSSGRVVPVAAEPSLPSQNVIFTFTTQSAAFSTSPRTMFVRIICDAKAHFVFGTNPIATATSPYLAPDIGEYFGVAGGGTWKVAFYDGSS